MEQVKARKFKFRTWMADFIELTNFALPLGAWKSSREIILSILLSSLGVNIMALVFPLTLLQIYDRIIPNQAIDTLVWLFIAVLISLLIGALLKIARIYIGAWADAKFEHVIGCQALDKILNCNLSEYEKEGSGRHLKRISALSMLRSFYAGQALISLVDVPFAVIFLAMIAYIGNWLVLVPIIVIVGIFYAAFSNTTIFQVFLNQRRDHDDRRLNFIVETITKVHTIKSNTMEAQMLRRYERLQKYSSFYDYKMTQQSTNLLADSVSLSQLTIIMIVAFGSAMVFNGKMSMGALAACTLLAGRCLQPVSTLTGMWSRLQTIKVAHEELDKVLNMESDTSSDMQPVENLSGKIVFENVSFRYSRDEPLILNECNLTVMPNETISISGEGLSGKSSIIWLILKLLKPMSGRILFDDLDSAMIEPASLHQQIGYLPQKTVLFQGTILDNITLFEDEYETRAKQLAEQVGLSSFVEHLPDGYDTKIGTQASETLPRGILQRIVIARALIHNPKIILFDEANVTLDMEGDKKLKELLEKLSKDHTIIIITHRPSISKLAQKHYVLIEGKLRLSE